METKIIPFVDKVLDYAYTESDMSSLSQSSGREIVGLVLIIQSIPSARN